MFLSTVMPLVGVFLVAASRGSGAAGMRRTACTNAALTLAMALAVLALYPVAGHPTDVEAGPDGHPVFRMVTARSLPLAPAATELAGRWQLLWPGLLTGVDGATAVLMLVFCGLCLAAILAAGSEHHRHPALLYGGLLLWQSLQLLSLVSLDYRLTVLAGAASLPVLFLLAGLWGGAERRRTTVTLMTVLAISFGLEAAAVLLLLDATIPLVGEILNPVRTSSALLPERLQLLLTEDGASAQWWQRVSSLAFPLLLISLLLRMGLAPVHGWFYSVYRQLPGFLRMVLPGWLLASGFSLAVRVLPLCPEHWRSASGWLLWFGLVSAGFVLLRAAGTRPAGERSALLLSAAGGLMIAALASPAETGLQTAVLLTVMAGLSLAIVNGQGSVDSVTAQVPRDVTSVVRSHAEKSTNAGTGESADFADSDSKAKTMQTTTRGWWPGLPLRAVLFGVAGLAAGIPLVTGAAATGAGLLNLAQPSFWLAVVWTGSIVLLCTVPAASRESGPAAGMRLAAVLPALMLVVVASAPSRLTSRMTDTAARFQQLTGSRLVLSRRISSVRRESTEAPAAHHPGLRSRTASAD
ncbi:MAG: hypothetical protein KDA79_12545 [Planctomycetaceae bacterium]|nr:hypothetical protein [Planctomycetaceae bacterium]